MLEIIDDRDQKGSLLITSQVPVARWREIIGDPTFGDAILRPMTSGSCVPSRRSAKEPHACPDYIYRHRNLIERCWSRLKERRAVATRYGKTAASYAAGIAVAASLDWIRAALIR